jgi:hypothetical protein
VAECLALDGTGGISVSDWGGRCITGLHIECVDGRPDKLRFKSWEYFRGLSTMIIAKNTKISKLLSLAAMSRVVRLQDAPSATTFESLVAKERAVANPLAAGLSLTRNVRRQLGVLRAHGVGSNRWRSELDALLEREGEEEEATDVEEAVRDHADEIVHDFRAAVQAAKDEVAVGAGNASGPLWTVDARAKYTAHCQMRSGKNLPTLSLRTFLRRIVEKRLNRKAKGLGRRLRGEVRRVQNNALLKLFRRGRVWLLRRG